jgi:hypothetical protein
VNEELVAAGGCAVVPALPPRWELSEADDGFTLDAAGPTACTLDGTAFACEPVTFAWDWSDGTTSSTLDETLTLTGEFSDSNAASGTARVDLECRDDECPNDGSCSGTLSFRITLDTTTLNF